MMGFGPRLVRRGQGEMQTYFRWICPLYAYVRKLASAERH